MALQLATQSIDIAIMVFILCLMPADPKFEDFLIFILVSLGVIKMYFSIIFV